VSAVVFEIHLLNLFSVDASQARAMYAAPARGFASAPRRLATGGFLSWSVVTVLQTERRTSVVARRSLPGPITARPTEYGLIGIPAAALTRPGGGPITLGDTALELGAELPPCISARRVDTRVYMRPETADGLIEMAPNADRLVLLGVGVVGHADSPPTAWVRRTSSDPVVVVWWRGQVEA